MSENKFLIRSTRLIGLATLASRILGFVRDVIIAKFFGTGMRAQAFVVAFRIPNLFRSLFGEGGTNSAVVPVLSRLDQEGKKEEFWHVATCLLNLLLILLAALTLLGELFMPYIVKAIAPGFIKDPQKLYLSIRLARLLFPYLLLAALSAYAMAVLNSLKNFVWSALAPCMLNISLIASALILCPRLKEPVDGLAIGVLAGGLLQIIIQIPILAQKGLFKKRNFRFMHPKIKEIGTLFLPRTLGIAVYQINIFVDTILGSLSWIVGQGAVAALYYSNRLVQFPLALFGLALAQVAIPTMSGMVAQGDLDSLKKTVHFSLRSVFTIMIPATVGIMVLSRPIVSVLFQRGSFTSYSTEITSAVLFFYCLGLTGYAGVKVLASCFYAFKDTLTPVKIAGIALLINIVLNLILMWPLKASGLALATAIAASINFAILAVILSKKIGHLVQLWSALARVTIAAAAMGSGLWIIFYRTGFLMQNNFLLAVKLGLTIIAGIFIYSVFLKIFAKEESEIFLGWILKRK
ncbi:MAG: murein biosynthesis integral membrane protein MurJ [Candidatus Omnitrophica bacterium]|nr:murein biosynthesis integral membrane protein MurJ [Candidatus Omnitrophota bacterium]